MQVSFFCCLIDAHFLTSQINSFRFVASIEISIYAVDLFLFYLKVQRAGGYEAAVANKLWKAIYIELGGHPSNTSAATCTRRHYEKYAVISRRLSYHIDSVPAR